MKPTVFFILVLRILGIFLSYHIIISLMTFLESFFVMFQEIPGYQGGLMIIAAFIPVALYLGIAYFLILRAEYLVKRLKLDIGFSDENLALSVKPATIYRISIIVSGLLILFFEIPSFFAIIYNIFEQKEVGFPGDKVRLSPLIRSGITILLGLLLIGERERLLRILDGSHVPEIEEKSIADNLD